MTDMKGLLDRTHSSAPEPTFDLRSLAGRRGRRRRSERLAAGFVGIAVTAALVVGMVIVSRDGGSVPRQGNIPSATTSVPLLRPGEYSYIRTRWIGGRVVFGPIAKDFEEGSEEYWIDRDGVGRSVEIFGGSSSRVTWPSPEDGPNWPALLPADPGALSDYLLDPAVAEASPVPENESTPGQSAASVRITGVAASVLGPGSDPLLSPAQRVAFLDLLGSYAGDGVSVDLEATDPAGREAYRYSFRTDSGPTIYEFYVDPATHDLLATLALISQSGQLDQARIVDRVGVTTTTDGSSEDTWVPRAGDRLDLPLDVSDRFAEQARKRRKEVFG